MNRITDSMRNKLNKWREENGLNYKGWLAFIVTRWLRRNHLKWVIPFDMYTEWRNSSNAEVTTYRFGFKRVEKLRFSDSLYPNDLMVKMRDGGINRRNIYLFLRSISK